MSETNETNNYTFLIFSGSFTLLCFFIIILVKYYSCKKTENVIINVTNNNLNIIIENDIENAEDIECSICLDTDYSTVITLSICNHKFHKNCLKKLKFCPNCRLGIN